MNLKRMAIDMHQQGMPVSVIATTLELYESEVLFFIKPKYVPVKYAPYQTFGLEYAE